MARKMKKKKRREGGREGREGGRGAINARTLNLASTIATMKAKAKMNEQNKDSENQRKEKKRKKMQQKKRKGNFLMNVEFRSTTIIMLKIVVSFVLNFIFFVQIQERGECVNKIRILYNSQYGIQRHSEREKRAKQQRSFPFPP